MQHATCQGGALLSKADHKEKFSMELKAMSDYLVKKKCIMGDKVLSFDATSLAWLAILSQGMLKYVTCDSV